MEPIKMETPSKPLHDLCFNQYLTHFNINRVDRPNWFIFVCFVFCFVFCFALLCNPSCCSDVNPCSVQAGSGSESEAGEESGSEESGSEGDKERRPVSEQDDQDEEQEWARSVMGYL